MKKSLHLLLFLFYINSISAKLHKDSINTFTYANSGDCITTTLVTVDAAAIITGNSSVCVGATSQLTGTGTPATANPWISSDTTVATINVSGLVTGVSAGTATITYTDSSGGSATVIVTVNPLPTASISGSQTICSGTGATITFIGTPNATVTYTVNPGSSTTILLDGTGTAILNAPALIATTTYSIVSVSTSGPLVCSQNIVGQSATITTTSVPIINKPTDYEECATSADNQFSCSFNLQTKNAEITTNPNVMITYHETVTNAQLGINPIPNGFYCNIVNSKQTIYVRVFDSSVPGCPSFTTLQLIVNPRPIPNANITNYELCDVNGDGVEGFDLHYKDAEIVNGLTGVTITYYSTLSDAQNQTGSLTSPYTSGSKTIWFNIKDNVKGCFSVGSFKIVVNPLPNAVQLYSPYSLCDVNNPGDGAEAFDLASKVSGILLGQPGMTVTFYPSLMDAQNNTNAITNMMYQNQVINSQIIGIRITNNKTGCYVISAMELRVEPLPTPVQPSAPFTVCDNNQDGLSTFDLAALTPGIANGQNYTITYHETLGNAQSGVNSLSSPYFNTLHFVQVIYAAAANNVTGCRSVVPVELNVEPSPVMPSLPNLFNCDLDSNTQDQMTNFDFTSVTGLILAAQIGTSTNFEVTYHTNQSDAQTGNSPIISVTNYLGTNGETIWVRIKDKTGVCYNVSSFQLLLTLKVPSQLNVCDNDAVPNDQFYTFDLTVKDAEINQGTGYPVTYYPSLADAQSGTNVITNPTAYTNVTPGVQTIGVAVTNSSNCKSITVLDIRVFKLPEPNTPPALPEKCDDNNPGDMVEVFDLTQNEAYIVNGDPTLTFHYYFTQVDALAGTNEIVTPSAALVGQNVWIRVENNLVDYQGNSCFVIIEQPLKVNPLPVVNSIPDCKICDENGDGFGVFDLSMPELAVSILGPNQLPNDFAISFYASGSGADPYTNTGEVPLPTSYGNTVPNTQDIYVRLVNINTGCFSINSLKLIVDSCTKAIPDTDFEQALIDLGYDNVLDGKVLTSSLSEVAELDLSNKNIADLTGIEAFTNLTSLNLANNNLTSLNFGSSDEGKNANINTFASLQTLICSGNQLLTSLDISGLTSLENLDCSGNPGLTCITVKDVAAAELNTNWIKDATAIYSTSCSKLAVDTPSLNNFRVVAYPNPSKNGFVMDVNTLSQEVLRIKVYDMLGKLVDQMEVNPNMISSQKIGQNYSTGIYNIVVTQENEIQTLRLIKE